MEITVTYIDGRIQVFNDVTNIHRLKCHENNDLVIDYNYHTRAFLDIRDIKNIKFNDLK